jgi:hypothetical protein
MNKSPVFGNKGPDQKSNSDLAKEVQVVVGGLTGSLREGLHLAQGGLSHHHDKFEKPQDSSHSYLRS